MATEVEDLLWLRTCPFSTQGIKVRRVIRRYIFKKGGSVIKTSDESMDFSVVEYIVLVFN